MPCLPDEVTTRLVEKDRLWIFLDYDGTLTGFAPTPETVTPDPEVIQVISELADTRGVRVTIVSGRRLDQTLSLIPINGIILAGVYGLQIKTPDGIIHHPPGYWTIRPTIEQVKSGWNRLIVGKQGFFLEDKDWTLALHARFASPHDARVVIAQARQVAQGLILSPQLLLIGGDRFLEVGPPEANKGRSLVFMMREFPCPGALPVYIGDDDKDEPAFREVRRQGGLAIRVGTRDRPTAAMYRIDTPAALRAWLVELAARRQNEVDDHSE